ncbi:hypothetical protein GQ600_17648 [Phytophthora cactorum]|nr:hypothetical protein GQ600_17648 [Phytophthora cactorum]
MMARTSTTWLTRFTRTGNSLRVEQRGHYSAERLIALQKYSDTANTTELLTLVLLTPLPCLFAIILADVAPLNPPEAGTNSNIVFWFRSCLIIWLYTLSFVVQFREMLPALPCLEHGVLGSHYLSAAVLF